MDTLQTQPRYWPEVRKRAVRMVLDHAREHPSQWAAISSIAAKIGYSAATLHAWVRQAERDSGRRPGLTTEMADRLKALGPWRSFEAVEFATSRRVRPLVNANRTAARQNSAVDRFSTTMEHLPLTQLVPSTFPKQVRSPLAPIPRVRLSLVPGSTLN